MNSIYDYVKEISIYLYKNDPNFEKNYPYIENLVLQCESLLANEKITDIKSNFNIEVKKSDPISYIVNQAREYIYNNRSDKKLKFDDKVSERVQFLIAHHHTYDNIDKIDWQILVEADFLVNMFENGVSKSAVQNAYDKIFKTAVGKEICKNMFEI